jgi:cephalosporin-C deacetylase
MLLLPNGCIHCKNKLLFFFILIQNLSFAQLSIQPDRENTRYEKSETALFRVSGAENGTLSYQILHTLQDTFPILGQGTVEVVNGTANIPFTSYEPCFVICKVLQNNQMVYAGVSFSLEELKPTEEEPADFDAFWAAQKAAVRAIPMDIHLNYMRTSGYSTVFNFDMAVVDGKRVYGYLVVPISKRGSYPALIEMPPYGNLANIVTDDVATAERAGVLTVRLTVHNAPPNVTAPAPNYLVEGIESPQSYYLKYVLLGAVKIMDYIQTRPDFNGQFAAIGISQGGGLAALIAGIDTRISLLATAYPAFCHQSGAKYQQPSAFPFTYLTAGNIAVPRETVLSTVKYYDPIYTLRRFKGVSWQMGSLKDAVCPAQATTTAFNQLKGQRILEYVFDKTHTQGPDEFFNSGMPNTIYAFLRRHFAACRLAPWPYNPTTTGYVIDAGRDTVLNGNNMTLHGMVGMNDTIAWAFPVKWEQIEGAGTVVFSSAHAHNTMVTFPQTGTYRLRFSAIDYSTLADNKYFLLSNDIVVTVKTIYPSAGATSRVIRNATLFPNPATTSLTLCVDGLENTDIKIYDLLGNLRIAETMDATEKTLDINALQAGNYWVVLKNNSFTSTQKFVKSF